MKPGMFTTFTIPVSSLCAKTAACNDNTQNEQLEQVDTELKDPVSRTSKRIQSAVTVTVNIGRARWWLWLTMLLGSILLLMSVFKAIKRVLNTKIKPG